MNDDRDLLIRTVIGEAGNQSDEGKAAVAHVVLNRLRTGGYGEDIPSILFKPAQFEPWNTRRRELLSVRPDSEVYRSAAPVVDAVLSGTVDDPTNGATHFANVATVQARGDRAGRPGGWLSTLADRVQIDDHTFGKADAGRGPSKPRFEILDDPPTPAPQAAGRFEILDDEPAKPVDAPQAQPVMGPDLTPAVQADLDKALVGEPSEATRAAAVSGSIANTALLGLPRNMAAGVRSLQSGRSFSDEYAALKARDAALARQHPVASGAGTVAGLVGGAVMLPAVRAAEGAGLAGRMLANAATGAGYGATQGALEDHSVQSAITGGLVGGAAGAVLTPVAEKVGAAVLNRWFAKPETFVSAAGDLTPEGAAAIKAAGLDPADVGASLKAELAEAFAQKGASDATAREVLARRFDIDISQGQAKQDFTQQQFENLSARGGYGQAAQETAGPFFTRQSDQATAAKARLGEDLAGAAAVSTPQEAGEVVTAGLRARAAARKADYQGKYDAVAEVPGQFQPGAFDEVAGSIQRSLAERTAPVDLDPVLTPVTNRALGTLADIKNQTIAGVKPVQRPVGAAPTSPLQEAPAPAATGGQGAPSAGNTVFTPAGRAVDVEYKVVDAGSLRTSHGPDLTVNPAYPQDLQPRDRTRAGSEKQIAEIAARLDGRRLGASASTADGAPIVGPDGLVESGNGRVLGIRRAYAANPERAAAYRAHLEAQGFETAGLREPVLVRVRRTPLDPAERIRFAQESNGSVGLDLSAAERAATDASRLGDALEAFRGGDPAAAENRDFVRAFVGRVADANEAGGLATGDGALSLGGEARIRNALLHAAYGDSGLVRALAETGDDNIKALGHVLGDVAGDVAKLKYDAAAGRVAPEADLSAALLEAGRFVQNARAKGLPLPTAVAQQDAFRQLSPEALAALQTVYGPDLLRRVNRTRAGEALRSAVADASQQSGGANMFGEAPLSARQILEAKAAKVAGEPEVVSAAQARQMMAEQAAKTAETPQAAKAAASVLPDMENSSGPLTMRGVDQIRKRLVAAYSTAKGSGNKTDARAVRAVIDEFDGHVERSIADGLFSGDEAALPTLREARAAFAKYRQTFTPTGPGDEVGRTMQKIVERDAQPQEVANLLFGQVKVGASGSSVRLAARLRDVLGPDSPEWSAIRQGLWQRLTTKPEGVDDFGPQALSTRIHTFLNGDGSGLARTLYSADELATMREFAAVMKILAPMKVRGGTSNPNSDTAPMLGSMIAKLSGRADQLGGMLGGLFGTGLAGAALSYGIGRAIKAAGSVATDARHARRAADAFSPLPHAAPPALDVPATAEVGTGAGLANDNLRALLAGPRSSAASDQREQKNR